MLTRGRFAVLVVAALAVTLVAVPAASSEQASSKAKRLPAALLDAGGYHTCAILASGRVRCWGNGAEGQLGYVSVANVGDDEAPGSTGPVSLGTNRSARALAAGQQHTCAILDTRAVRCWGAPYAGQLGYGNTNPIGDDETPGSVGPVNLGAGRKAVAITAGGEHTCAILDNRALRCWGSGSHGRTGHVSTNHVGDDETPGSVAPVNLGAGRAAVAISAGKFHTCAILDNGSVRCFGLASSGQLGYGNTDHVGDDETPGSVGPVDLGAGRTAVALALGDEHSCALLDDGTVRCWGKAVNGELGYGNTDAIGDDETPGTVGPVDLGAGRKAVAIAAGGAHTCVVLDDGNVRCWGIGGEGILGYGNTDSIGDDETPGTVGPVNLGTGRTAVAIAAAQSHTCALLDNGRARCWGWSGHGSLGYGNTDSIGDDETPDSAGPVDLAGLVPPRPKPALSLALKPKRDRSAPYRFRVSGALSGFPADSVTCTGKLTVRARKGGKRVVAKPALRAAGGACTYAASLRVPGPGRWSVTATFPGNGSLAAKTSAARRFTAG